MSIDRYFDKFPIISYANNQVVDITKRVAMLEKVSRNPYAFYPYDIVGDERADQLSSRYYEDSYKSWLLYITNKITDPYYEWYLTEREFLEFLEKKYGSIYTSSIKRIRSKVQRYQYLYTADHFLRARKIRANLDGQII